MQYDDWTPNKLARKLCATLFWDLENHLIEIDRYIHGQHKDPYMPDSAGPEYKLLAKRAVNNWFPLLIDTPAQGLHVDSYRRGEEVVRFLKSADSESSPEWKHWERSRLSSRQNVIHRASIGYGHSFTVTEKDRVTSKSVTRGLSPLHTSAVFEDDAPIEEPYAALSVIDWPDEKNDELGFAYMWDDEFRYEVTFKLLNDLDSIEVGNPVPHGNSACPVTRFAAAVDLEGRTVGVVEPLMILNDRINQTVFDLLVVQTFGSFKVRWTTGMAPPMETEPDLDEEGNVVGVKLKLGSDGQPIPKAIPLNASRFLFGQDHETRFGTLDETPLDGYIAAIDMNIRHLSAISQTPPHYLLGQIANLSAEALTAAESALARKIEVFKNAFAESWERVFRLAAELDGVKPGQDDFSGEVVWRDMESRSLSQTADALGKLQQGLQIPPKGLWPRVPGVTQVELDQWETLYDEEDLAGAQMAGAMNRAAGYNAFSDGSAVANQIEATSQGGKPYGAA